MIVVWKLDRLGRSLTHLVNTVQDLSTRGVGLRVLTGQGAQIDTTTAAGRGAGRVRAELIRERTLAGLTAARARGRHGGGTFALSKTQGDWSAWAGPPRPTNFEIAPVSKVSAGRLGPAPPHTTR